MERSEYRTSDLGTPAPAFECTNCRTLMLDPSAAHSEEERDSVRLAIAAQLAVISDDGEPATGPESDSP